MTIAPKTITVDNPKHPDPGAKLIIAREGLPIAPEYANHPAVLEALAAVPKAPAEGDLADVDGGVYDGAEWTQTRLKDEVEKRGLVAASARKADLIAALEDADAG